MNNLIGQVSYPVFMYMVWVFFLVVSGLVFIVGLGLALRSPTMMRFFDLMNRWVSVRKMMKPLSVPHYVEPVLLKRPILPGAFIVAGATASVFMLKDFETGLFTPVFLGNVPYATAVVLAGYTKWFLVIGNALCALVGVLMLFSPALLSRLEAVADMWYSVRKRTLPLTQTHTEVDQWVLAHPTVSGIALIVMSLGLAASVLDRI